MQKKIAIRVVVVCALVLSGYVGRWFYLSSEASPDEVAVAAMTSSCAMEMLSQEKPGGTLRGTFHNGDVWTVGDLNVVQGICEEKDLAGKQAIAAKTADRPD
ncbi:hypothetical protein ACFQDN_21845 [Pseudomonas asuensis]|uniref:Secreted protein n=1 Tax=Pseudomonas asuensis TaxID=1825787 RepID=A0ABQ2H2Y3_9PSED|nr:hypothetical protein [Pseudomonas asuensis]GGM25350.1 hypothetical protein GCM10009425_40140 [Pseudomonas asuensis]